MSAEGDKNGGGGGYGSKKRHFKREVETDLSGTKLGFIITLSSKRGHMRTIFSIHFISHVFEHLVLCWGRCLGRQWHFKKFNLAEFHCEGLGSLQPCPTSSLLFLLSLRSWDMISTSRSTIVNT